MKNKIAGISLGLLIEVVVLMPGDSSGLTIYRFGGEDLPPSQEADNVGVNFIQLGWSNIDASLGGKASNLIMDSKGVRPLQYDPQVNMVPQARERITKEIGCEYEISGKALDGNLNTGWTTDSYICNEYTGPIRKLFCDEFGFGGLGRVALDLGGLFLIDRIRIVSGLTNQQSVVKDFRISLFPPGIPFKPSYCEGLAGSSLPSGAIPFTIDIKDNTQPFRNVIIPLDHQKARALRVTVGEHFLPWEVAEIEVYVRGVVDKATYISNIIDIGRPAVWGEIRWSGDKAHGAQIPIQTRSGLDDDATLYWRFTGRGGEKVQVSRPQYSRLSPREKAGTTYDQENWTFWSGPYDFADGPGTPVISSSPRRFFQFKVDFISAGEPGSKLTFLELRASMPPVASKLVGEIYPNQAKVGRDTRLVYALKSTVRGDDTGFDILKISTPALITAIHSMKIGDVGIPFTVATMGNHGFEVRFSKVDKSKSGVLLEVEFDAQIFRHESSFNAWVSDSSRPLEVPQPIRIGDATDESEGNTISVGTSAAPSLLLKVDVSPKIFTPNGDGVNEITNISYGIFEITTLVPVTVEIRALTGELVREVYLGEIFSGWHECAWDGRDVSGALVPPGVYLYRVSMNVAKKKIDKTGTIHVVY